MEKGYSPEEISFILKGQLIKRADQESIRYLLLDSRRIVLAHSSLFFAIKGERNDGHRFIPEMVKAGVRNFVISEYTGEFDKYQVNFIKVDDTRDALQQLAAHHRKKFSFPVIGITGSNGKTIVKEWLYQLLSEDVNIVRSPKSYNSQIGVPLSVWQMDESHQLGIFEAGISRKGEMERLEKVIRPEIGIFTNIGEAHDENFHDKREKAEEKIKLFTHSKLLIYCNDYEIIGEAARKQGLNTFSWSFEKEQSDLKITGVHKTAGATSVTAVYKNEETVISIPFSDDASVENAIHCWCVLLYMNYDSQTVRRRMKDLAPVAMRLQLKSGINNCTVINDSYNSDLNSLQIALDFLGQQKQHTRKTLILSDILQSGEDDASLYSRVAALIEEKRIDRFIGIGLKLFGQAGLFKVGEKEFYRSTDDFLRELRPSAFRDETVLIKGARVFEFERISGQLQQKSHKTVLEIDLNALVHNLNYYRSRLKEGVKVMAMVKATSYGSGSFEIANILQFHRVDYLAVAYADEGVELRKAGITLPVMVMNPEEQSFSSIIDFGLEPEIYSFGLLEEFSGALADREKPGFPVHIKLDTGMHRLGFESKDIEKLGRVLSENKHVRVVSVFSHMVGSEDPEHDEFSRRQFTEYGSMQQKLSGLLGYGSMRHILNSAGILRFPEAQFDMVRLGIGLYGIGPDAGGQMHLQEVASLKTAISQIKEIRAGDTIGYSRRGVALADMRIATVAIGYADGLNRRLSNGNGSLVVKGRKAPIVGNICMDMCMIDITGIDAKEGDEVIVFGKGRSVNDIAREMGTIPYEVLTTISPRVKRVYYHD